MAVRAPRQSDFVLPVPPPAILNFIGLGDVTPGVCVMTGARLNKRAPLMNVGPLTIVAPSEAQVIEASPSYVVLRMDATVNSKLIVDEGYGEFTQAYNQRWKEISAPLEGKSISHVLEENYQFKRSLVWGVNSIAVVCWVAVLFGSGRHSEKAIGGAIIWSLLSLLILWLDRGCKKDRLIAMSLNGIPETAVPAILSTIQERPIDLRQAFEEHYKDDPSYQQALKSFDLQPYKWTPAQVVFRKGHLESLRKAEHVSDLYFKQKYHLEDNDNDEVYITEIRIIESAFTLIELVINNNPDVFPQGMQTVIHSAPDNITEDIKGLLGLRPIDYRQDFEELYDDEDDYQQALALFDLQPYEWTPAQVLLKKMHLEKLNANKVMTAPSFEDITEAFGVLDGYISRDPSAFPHGMLTTTETYQSGE